MRQQQLDIDVTDHRPVFYILEIHNAVLDTLDHLMVELTTIYWRGRRGIRQMTHIVPVLAGPDFIDDARGVYIGHGVLMGVPPTETQIDSANKGHVIINDDELLVVCLMLVRGASSTQYNILPSRRSYHQHFRGSCDRDGA